MDSKILLQPGNFVAPRAIKQATPPAKRDAAEAFSPQSQPVKRVKREPTRYDEAVETLSDIGVYSPEYDRAVEVVRKIRKTVLLGYEKLREAGYSTDEGQKICEDFSRITIDPNDIRRKLSVGFVGNMGSGKLSFRWTFNAITADSPLRKIVGHRKFDRLSISGYCREFTSCHKQCFMYTDFDRRFVTVRAEPKSYKSSRQCRPTKPEQVLLRPR